MNDSDKTSRYVPHVGWLEFFSGDDVDKFLCEGWFEYREQAFLWLYLRQGDVVVDGGAHVGLYSVLAGRILQGSGRVVAVEPMPRTVDLLRNNLQRNEITTATVIEAAFSSCEGVLPFHVMPPGKAAYDSLYVSVSNGHDIEVNSVTIDALLDREQVGRVDFLKLDIEGAEIDALTGAMHSMANGRLPLIMVEFTELNLRSAKRTTEDLRQALELAGYALCGFDADSLQLVAYVFDGPVWYDNLFAVRDIDYVNRRLQSATEQNKTIAADIIARGRASKKVKDECERQGHEITALQQENMRRESEKSLVVAEVESATSAIARLEQAYRQLDSDKQMAVAALEGELEQLRYEKADLQAEITETRNSLKIEIGNPEARLEEVRQWHERERAGFDAGLDEIKKWHENEKCHLLQEIDVIRERLEKERAISTDRLSLLRREHLQHTLAERRIDQELLCRWPLRLAFKYRLAKPPLWAVLRGNGGRGMDNKVERYIAENSCGNEMPAIVGDARGATPAVSVVLCTYNPKPELLSWALESIAKQSMPTSRYEVILVDNNSRPKIDLSAYPITDMIPIRRISEERQGLIFARLAGIRESRADLIVFVDDDNHLDAAYLENAADIAKKQPEIGLFGGVSRGRLEVSVPEWKRKLLPYLGVRDDGEEAITSFESHWGPWEPIGAGMVARKDVADAYLEFVENNPMSGGLGRQGGALFSCEDSLFARIANQKGYACSYQPRLGLEHYIAEGRLKSGYLYRLIRDLGRSYVRLEHVLGRGQTLQSCSFSELMARLVFQASREGVPGLFRWAWNLGYRKEMALVDLDKHKRS